MTDVRLREFDELVALALQLLPEMVLPDGSFSNKTVVENGAYRNTARNDLYSGMALIGLLESGHAQDPGMAEIVGNGIEALAKVVPVTNDGAVLATAAWVFALTDDARAREAIDRMESVVDPGRATSMQLGLVLSGSSLAAERCAAARDNAVLVADAARDELLERWAPGGSVFRGHRPSVNLRTLAHFRFASFASQVYPLLGLAMAAECLGRPLPKEAVGTADWLVESQGPNGEWWWWYGVKSRRIVEGYPVYIVHQHAMAFMALAPIQRLTGVSYEDALWRGVDWIGGSNPLGAEMVAADPPMTYRAIQRRGGDADWFSGMSASQYVLALMSSVRLGLRSPTEADAARLEVLREARSYELGWLLLARALLDRLD